MMFARCPACEQIVAVLISDVEAGRFECPSCKFATKIAPKIRVVDKSEVVE